MLQYILHLPPQFKIPVLAIVAAVICGAAYLVLCKNENGGNGGSLLRPLFVIAALAWGIYWCLTDGRAMAIL